LGIRNCELEYGNWKLEIGCSGLRIVNCELEIGK
jgi:hypothetical protein